MMLHDMGETYCFISFVSSTELSMHKRFDK
jgi:hypothetical protein